MYYSAQKSFSDNFKIIVVSFFFFIYFTVINIILVCVFYPYHLKNCQKVHTIISNTKSLYKPTRLNRPYLIFTTK